MPTKIVLTILLLIIDSTRAGARRDADRYCRGRHQPHLHQRVPDAVGGVLPEGGGIRIGIYIVFYEKPLAKFNRILETILA